MGPCNFAVTPVLTSPPSPSAKRRVWSGEVSVRCPLGIVVLPNSTVFEDALSCKDSEILQFKGKRGIYLWTHKKTLKQYFSTLNKKEMSSLNPFFITGFSDAESSFIISVAPDSRTFTGWQVRPIFRIGLHSKELPLLLEIQNFFNGIGNISLDSKNKVASWNVTRNDDIINYIISHFNSFPLITQKRVDFYLWCKILDIIQKGGHRTNEGLQEILSIKSGLNLGVSSKLKEAFPDLKLQSRPSLNFEYEINPQWLTGFVSGEGSFSASLYSLKLKAYRARFYISQHERDLVLLEKIASYLGTGKVYKNGKSTFNFEVSSYKNNYDVILPFFIKHPLPPVCLKATNFLIWKQILETMKAGLHKGSQEQRSKLDNLITTLNNWD